MASSWRLIDWERVDWAALDRFADRTVFQTPEWLRFIADSQHGAPVIAELCEGERIVAYFSGVVVNKFGIRILGSPFHGWTTAYMGFNAANDADRAHALHALPALAFGLLRCAHFETMDLALANKRLAPAQYSSRTFETLQSDLLLSEDELFDRMTSACRRCIRKAAKSGVTIVEVSHEEELENFVDCYYDQLRDVFAKQGLVPTYGKERVHALIRNVWGTGNLLLLRALDPDGECIASSIYAGMRKLAFFWGNASYREGQTWRPNEALHWHAVCYWKHKGATTFDWGGASGYKFKYGGERVDVLSVRHSRYPGLEVLRSAAQGVFAVRQKISGAFTR
jgi:CelD/BcsL family acetyltransferase involved in cellulose biosynthesis